MQGILKAFFKTKNERDVRRMKPIVDRINVIEEEYQGLSDDGLRAKTQEFRDRIAGAGRV